MAAVEPDPRKGNELAAELRAAHGAYMLAVAARVPAEAALQAVVADIRAADERLTVAQAALVNHVIGRAEGN